MYHAGKIFVKTCVEASGDTFFAIVEFANIWHFYLTQEWDPSLPLSPVPSLTETSWFPHEENTKGAWSAYCNGFLSKQKTYSL